jgi:GntR family transcriptional regulator
MTREARLMTDPHTPKYARIASAIRTRVQSGALEAGQQLPAETAIAAEFGASVPTVRQAMALLRHEGLIDSRHGIGTFVRGAPPLKYYASMTGSRQRRLAADRRLDTFAQQIQAQDKTPRQVSTVETVEAPEEVAQYLGLPPGTAVAVRRRVMYADGQPLQLGDSYYPLDIVQDSKIMNPTDIPEGTDQVLEDLGHVPTRYDDEITWRMPSPQEAETLELAPAIPVGQLTRTTTDQHGRRVEVYLVVLPGNRHVLHYDISAE